jgi:gamma-glutamylcyclotransferase (GGCT)/AIG2-like uncharacterized protein YtfP
MHSYFAYGSNLDPVQMSQRCPGSRVIGCARLLDHRLVFPRPYEAWDRAGVAGIEPAPGHVVEGVAYELTDADLATLDEYEGIEEGEYRRQRVVIELFHGAGRLDVWTYYATPQGDGHWPPSRRYLDALLRGARHHGMTDAYIRTLEAIPTVGDGEHEHIKPKGSRQ